jgi:hypothetical protein
MAHSHSSALVHQASSLGLGRYLLLHLGQFHGPFITEHPFRSDGRLWNSMEQNQQRMQVRNPSPHSISSPFLSLCLIEIRSKLAVNRASLR